MGWRRTLSTFQIPGTLFPSLLVRRVYAGFCMFVYGQPILFHLLPRPSKCLHAFILFLNLCSVTKHGGTSKQTEQRVTASQNPPEVHWGLQKVRNVHGCKWVSDLTAIDVNGSSHRPSPLQNIPLSGISLCGGE